MGSSSLGWKGAVPLRSYALRAWRHEAIDTARCTSPASDTTVALGTGGCGRFTIAFTRVLTPQAPMLAPSDINVQSFAPAGTRPSDFPADLPFIPDVAAEIGTTPLGAMCRWLIPISTENDERQREAPAASAGNPSGHLKAVQGSEQASTIASDTVNALAEDATNGGWVRVTKPDTHWRGMVECRGFTRGDRYLEICAMASGSEPFVMAITGRGLSSGLFNGP